MNTIPQTSACSLGASPNVDLEKQELSDAPESLTQGDTTVVGDELDDPGKRISTLCYITGLIAIAHAPTIKRSITDYLRKVSLPERFPEPFRRRTEPLYDEEQRIKRIESHPKGYPQLAAFINSDENFSMCRRFGFLHQRVLLYRQDELRDLEDQLIRLDDEDQEEMPKALKSRKLDDVREGSYRKALIQTIDDKLKEYGNLPATQLTPTMSG